MTKKHFSPPSLESIRDMIIKENTRQALQVLRKHYMPSNDVETNTLYADALRIEEKWKEAFEIYRKAALAGGSHTLALWQRVAEMQVRLHDVNGAILSLKQALSLDPGNLELHQRAGQLIFSSTLYKHAVCHARHVFEKCRDENELALAENIYRFALLPYETYLVAKRRLECSETPEFYTSLIMHGAQGICEWDTVAHYAGIIDTQYYAKGDFNSLREIPLYNLARTSDEAVNYQVASMATSHLETLESPFMLPHTNDGKRERIRVGLLSADFADHPVIQLIIGLFEHIDKQRFELFAFDDGKNNPDGQRRMINAMDKHIDVRGQSDLDVAQKAYDEHIDILIDLMGLTGTNRHGVLALRPCPVTATFLGFPGTSGLSKIDYIITDPTITPDSSKPYYAEKLCRLPEVFMPTDSTLAIARNELARADAGLPEDAVVFCSFNRSFKLDEASVNLWMRILARVPGSVLWQKGGEKHMQNVFRETAVKHGVDPSRIIFAGYMASVPLHLKLAGLADLALDTLIYNGHTITVDMLWAGVPVITRKGTHFASRVSSSLLQAVGLEDCIAHSLEEMEDLAVALALDPARRAELRQRLARNKTYMPLFDTERYTRHFETALTMMFERAEQGLPPDHIDVPPLPPRCPAGEHPEEHAFLRGGQPQVFDELASLQTGGAYTDTLEGQAQIFTPYAIQFGNCPLCDKPSGVASTGVDISSNPLWREPFARHEILGDMRTLRASAHPHILGQRRLEHIAGKHAFSHTRGKGVS